MAAVGENIKKARQARGLSQQELGEAIGVGQSRIADIERNRNNNITLDVVYKIANALKISPVVLIEQPMIEELRAERLPSRFITQLSRLESGLTVQNRAALVDHARALYLANDQSKDTGPSVDKQDQVQVSTDSEGDTFIPLGQVLLDELDKWGETEDDAYVPNPPVILGDDITADDTSRKAG